MIPATPSRERIRLLLSVIPGRRNAGGTPGQEYLPRTLYMPLKITSSCINCGVCELACPNDAIKKSKRIYVIAPDLCTECVGFFKKVQCDAVCPVGSCVPDSRYVMTKEALFERAEANHLAGYSPKPTIKPKTSWWARLFTPAATTPSPTEEEK